MYFFVNAAFARGIAESRHSQKQAFPRMSANDSERITGYPETIVPDLTAQIRDSAREAYDMGRWVLDPLQLFPHRERFALREVRAPITPG